MKRSKYTIRKEFIVSGSIPDMYFPGISGSIVYNTDTSSLALGYYQYNGSIWQQYSGSLTTDYELPVYLDAKAKEMGNMIPFDGNIFQLAEPNVTVNFLYDINGCELTIYNTTDYSQLKNNAFPEVIYTINWGNGDSSNISANGHITYSGYNETGVYKIQITLDAPWIQENTFKFVYINQTCSSCRILTEDEVIIDNEYGDYLNREECGVTI